MKVDLPWGDGEVTVHVPSGWELVYPKGASGIQAAQADEQSIVADALHSPAGASPISGKSLADRKIVIVVDDNTRPTPAWKFFHLIVEELCRAGARKEDLLVLTALGIHTPMTAEEMAVKIGSDNAASIRWENHDAHDDSLNVYMGKTGRGTSVHLNRHVKEADFIVLVGLVEPHLMAGFGGGMKNILPGVASAGTIGAHHEILTEPPYKANRVGMMPDANSFRTDLEEARQMVTADIFCVNVVLDTAGRIAACFAGDPIDAHRQGVAYTVTHSGLNMDRQVDGVITNSRPMDFNFKQSMKCVGNVLPALKPGGVVMGFLRAQRGLDDLPDPEGSPLPLWMVKRILRLIGPSRVYGFLNRIKKGMDIEEKFLHYYTLQLIREYELYLYVPSLSEQEINKLFFFTGFRESPEDVIAAGVRKLGENAVVAVFPEGGATFPVQEDLS
mgnify:CR=1 FL=1